jgi:hypothetical protein
MSKPPGTSGGKQNDALYRASSATTLVYLARQWGLAAEYIVTSHRYIYQRGKTSVSDVPVTLLQVHTQKVEVSQGTEEAGQWVSVHRGETLDRKWGW